jgi:hypothetical protein
MMSAKRRTGEPPVPTSGVLVRPLLAAGLAFMDAVPKGAFRIRDAVGWLEGYLVAPGLMPMPSTIQEPAAGVVPIGEASTGGWVTSLEARMSRVANTARTRVAVVLGGLCANRPDDRFLAGAIAAGRVSRMSGDHGPAWRPSPAATDRLSDVVLSLFVADILANREEYDANLCVCDLCAKVSLTPNAEIRTRCAQHRSSLLR